MGAGEDYEMKLEVITAIEDSGIKTPHHIPVDVYIQEADTLYHWCQADKEVLTAVGLSWELVEDLPIRIGALTRAESLWYVQRNTRDEAAGKWAEKSPLAYDLRNRVLKAFRFAFRRHPDFLTKLRAIARAKGHPGLIQGLNDLAVLGRDHPDLLKAINLDMSLPDKAAQAADEMAALLAEVTASKAEYSKTKKIRDQAYTHLKAAVDEIREYGQYVFRQNRERFNGYRSYYVHMLNKKGGKVSQGPESVTAE
jgi:hypothetical protein